MRTEDKTMVQNSIGRGFVSLLSLILQAVWIIILAQYLNDYSTIIATVTSILALTITVIIYNKEDTPVEFKLPLIMLILAFPIIGLCMVFMIERKGTTRKMKSRFLGFHRGKSAYITQDEEVIQELEQDDFGIANQFRYLSRKEGFPVFNDSSVVYHDNAKDAYENMLDGIRHAKEFVFLEYHAIEDGYSFDILKQLLIRRVAEGVEVRILYDDVGSIGFLNGSFRKKMEQAGIKCKVFNRISPAFRIFMNNRDHRKITVVDGKKAYTGGYNLADEYFGVTHPYGQWKDSGIEITGNAVNSMTEMFLAMWNSMEKIPEEFDLYYRYHHDRKSQCGYIQPYADNPLDDNYVGENAYMNMIKNAKKSLYITTPYLILGNSMQRELQMAADRGVDVRIITPGIPDKKVIYRVTRSYYEILTRHGIKIYEYSPGFLHEKQMVSDGEVAIVGTINMDYRSFYHHFENAVLMYRTNEILKINQDFEHIFDASLEVTEEYCIDRKKRFLILDGILRLMAPLF